MFKPQALIALGLAVSSATAALVIANDDQDMSGLIVNSIPYSTRVKYMRLVSFLALSFFISLNIPDK
jgi:hypothetical protein